MDEGSGLMRLAGGLVVALGAANAVLGLLSLLTSVVRLPLGIAGGLLVVGLVTAAAGVLVWRGNRLVTAVALTVFGLLLVAQLGDALTAGPAPVTGPTDNPVLRLVVLAVVVAALAAAAWTQRRRRVGGPSATPDRRS